MSYLSGYLAAAKITVNGTDVKVASVHTVARQVDDVALTDEDHMAVRRPGLERGWHNDLTAASLRAWVDGGPFVVGGDWNTARLFDEVHPAGAEGAPGASGDFFEVLGLWGWCESLRKFHTEEVKTYLKVNTAGYELDHLFTDTTLHDRLRRCDVVEWCSASELSDHAAIVADLEL